MGKRRLNGSTFDLLPLGDLADLAAVAADYALIDALSGRAPGTVPPASSAALRLTPAAAPNVPVVVEF
jgi:hypothetical protein